MLVEKEMGMVKKPSALVWYGILLVLWVILALLLPVPHLSLRMVHISQAEYRLVILSLVVPYSAIWFSAFFAYDKLSAYAKQIRSTREGPTFTNISRGVGVLAWGLAVSAILSLILNAIAANHPSFINGSAIIINYISLILALVSFTFIGNGTHALTTMVKARPSLTTIRILTLVFITIGVLFTRFAISNNGQGNNSPYHLELYVLIITVILPYLFAWFVGLFGAHELWLYAQKARGVLYKRVLVQLTIGISVVIVASIIVQYVSVIFGTRTRYNLGWVLLLIYLLLAIEALGYALIALSAKGLKRFEEI